MKKKIIKTTKTPWPTKKAMEQVYNMKLWGDNTTRFYSGDGSHNPKIVTPYIAIIASFFKTFKSPPIVCDLGCGDFNIGKQLLSFSSKYVAIDIVPDLIAYNKSLFKHSNLEFKCLDLAKDDLPTGDCAILRQVLQHLSNTEIQSIISKLYAFKYVIITEHLPHDNFVPNKDIISGQGIRLKKQSGLDLLAPPFNLKIKSEQLLLSVNLDNGKGRIDTTLYTMF